MTTIPERTPSTASPRELPVKQRRIPGEVEERLPPEPSAPIRKRQILRQETETKPIPNLPNPTPESRDQYEPRYEPRDEPS